MNSSDLPKTGPEEAITDEGSEKPNPSRVNLERDISRREFLSIAALLTAAAAAGGALPRCGGEDVSEALECDPVQKGPQVDFKKNDEGKPECSFEGNLVRAVVKLDGVHKECGRWPVTLILMGTFLQDSKLVEKSLAEQVAATPGEYVFHEILTEEGVLSLRIQATDARGNRTLTVPVEKL